MRVRDLKRALEGVDENLIVIVKVAGDVGMVVAPATECMHDTTDGTPCFVIDADEDAGED